MYLLLVCKVPNRAVVTIQTYWNQVFIGEEFTVRCEIDGSEVTEWEYEWRRPNSNKPSKRSEHSVSIASEYDSGHYMCKGTKGFYFSTEWSKPIAVTVSRKYFINCVYSKNLNSLQITLLCNEANC